MNISSDPAPLSNFKLEQCFRLSYSGPSLAAFSNSIPCIFKAAWQRGQNTTSYQMMLTLLATRVFPEVCYCTANLQVHQVFLDVLIRVMSMMFQQFRTVSIANEALVSIFWGSTIMQICRYSNTIEPEIEGSQNCKLILQYCLHFMLS